jgi:hypothetical protein
MNGPVVATMSSNAISRLGIPDESEVVLTDVELRTDLDRTVWKTSDTQGRANRK